MFEALMLALAPVAPPVLVPAPPPIPVQAYATKWPAPRPWLVEERGLTCIAGQVLPDAMTQAAVWLGKDGALKLMVLDSEIAVTRKERVTIDLRFDDGPTGRLVDATSIQVNSTQKGFAARFHDEKFLDRFASASAMIVVKDGRPLMTVILSGSAAAVRQLRKCVAAIPVMPPVLIAPASPPPPPPAPRKAPARILVTNRYVTAYDYPARAMRRGVEGTTKVTIDVDTAGHPSNCKVVQSSGDADLDFASCLLMEDRFHYLPAIDAKGQPHAATTDFKFTWRMPEDQKPRASPLPE